MRRTILKAAVGLVALLGLSLAAAAQSAWPGKPIKIIVPWPPGGAADITVRSLQQPLSEVIGQPVVVENKSGGSGVIGMEAMVRAAPDGLTLGVAISAHTASPYIFATLPYDPVKDVKPITILTRAPNVLSVHPSSPHKSLDDLIAAAKAQPGKVLMATSGNGTAQHFALEQLKILLQTDIGHVPYRGAGPALNDLVAGQVQIGILNIAGSMAHIKAERLRPLAVTGLTRSPSLPDVPVFAEKFPGFGFSEWFALVAPAGVPDDTIDKLYEVVSKAARTKAFVDRVSETGLVVDLNTPAEFRTFMAAEFKKLGDLAKAANIKPE